MKLSSFLAKVACVTVDFEDDKLNLKYKPGIYTPAFEAQVDAAADQKDKDKLSFMLAGLICGWDLTDDDGGTLPFDEATLRTYPVPLLVRCLKAIIQDFSPKDPTSASSGNG